MADDLVSKFSSPARAAMRKSMRDIPRILARSLPSDSVAVILRRAKFDVSDYVTVVKGFTAKMSSKQIYKNLNKSLDTAGRMGMITDELRLG